MSRTGKKAHVFQREAATLSESSRLVEKIDDLDNGSLKKAYEELHENYSELLGDAKLVTSVSDRLQNKLGNTNGKLNQANQKITQQNQDLRQVIIELKKAKLEKKATTIVLLLAVALFLISEAFIEPRIEAAVDNWWYGLGLKGLIALLLKPLEILVERVIVKPSIIESMEIATQPKE
ncbi:MAG: flagellar hook-basal body complex protein FliE [Flammeovirgaceae bacterium]|jgi:flagellar hook-basal body complex protein FliE